MLASQKGMRHKYTGEFQEYKEFQENKEFQE